MLGRHIVLLNEHLRHVGKVARRNRLEVRGLDLLDLLENVPLVGGLIKRLAARVALPAAGREVLAPQQRHEDVLGAAVGV